jgi:hypothetical protein
LENTGIDYQWRFAQSFLFGPTLATQQRLEIAHPYALPTTTPLEKSDFLNDGQALQEGALREIGIFFRGLPQLTHNRVPLAVEALHCLIANRTLLDVFGKLARQSFIERSEGERRKLLPLWTIVIGH